MDKSGLPPMNPYLKCPFPGIKLTDSSTLFTTLPEMSRRSSVNTTKSKKTYGRMLLGGFLTASSVRRCTAIIARRNNKRIWKKLDAAKFLDEAKRGLWNDPKVPSFRILKRVYDNQAFHFRDEKN